MAGESLSERVGRSAGGRFLAGWWGVVRRGSCIGFSEYEILWNTKMSPKLAVEYVSFEVPLATDTERRET
jgi:hypothetical protein